MSRSGYSDDLENWDLIRYRGMVASAIRGKRGQAFLKELLKALDEMPVKELIAHEMEHNGQVCAIGALGKKRGVNMKDFDPDDCFGRISETFNIADCLAREIMYENDEDFSSFANEDNEENLKKRWRRMREWVVEHINPPLGDE